MARIKGNIEWLVDEVNGQIVGQKRPDGKEISLATVETNPLTGGKRILVEGELFPLGPSRYVGYEGEQPAEITGVVKKYGRLVTNFTTGRWTLSSGAPTLIQGYTGWDGSGNKIGITSRTGQPEMLKVVPAANTSEEIRINNPETDILTAALNGKLGIWLYIESQPGYQANGTVAGSINLDISTTSAGTNRMYVGFNANQLREGWNFLKFVQRNPAAYVVGSGVTEYHPFGITITSLGTGADTDLVNGSLSRLLISWSNMLGATLYFDSIWTDFDATPQVVLGNDGGVNLIEIALPVFEQYGWVGYLAETFNTVDSGTANCTLQSNFTKDMTRPTAIYAAGWDVINHTVTHPSVGKYTREAAIVYQVEQAKAWLLAQGYIRGTEFYASPQSSSSRLSEGVIKSLGYKLQRHTLKWNVSVTPFGVDNPHHIGAIDIGSSSASGIMKVTGGVSSPVNGWQVASKIKRAIDVVVAYGDSIFPFWHGITTTGDSGSGEDLTGDNLLLTESAFRLSMAHIRELELAGSLRVCPGITGFWYGV
ncbi:MAG TPA: polysaccharide deacetylase family protein [Bellilinea sp.]|nr:polysaccharide deacetylase family protein [Bellilinea sp.]